MSSYVYAITLSGGLEGEYEYEANPEAASQTEAEYNSRPNTRMQVMVKILFLAIRCCPVMPFEPLGDYFQVCVETTFACLTISPLLELDPQRTALSLAVFSY
jgi:hypothetical protein